MEVKGVQLLNGHYSWVDALFITRKRQFGIIIEVVT